MYLVSNTKKVLKKVIFFPNTMRKLKKFREDKSKQVTKLELEPKSMTLSLKILVTFIFKENIEEPGTKYTAEK